MAGRPDSLNMDGHPCVSSIRVSDRWCAAPCLHWHVLRLDFHGLGVEAEGTAIFLDKPSSLQRMRQLSFKGGAIYKTRSFYRLRPYAKALIGVGSIDFPSNDPLYTHDTFLMEAFGAGAEYPVWNTLNVRADYEYELWNQYFGNNNLTPNGFTIGATYYFRKIHKHL